MENKSWNDWVINPPPKNTLVYAKYSVNDIEQIVKTCKLGCCVSRDGYSMFLPKYWAEYVEIPSK